MVTRQHGRTLRVSEVVKVCVWNFWVQPQMICALTGKTSLVHCSLLVFTGKTSHYLNWDPPSNQATCFFIHRLPPSEQPLRKCQVSPLQASLELSTWVCGQGNLLRHGWEVGKQRKRSKVLFGRENFEKAVLLLGVWSCVKILCWVHTFAFLISWVKFHCAYMPHARKWMGKCEGKKEAGEVVGQERTKTIFVWKMSWWVLILCKLVTSE